MKLFLNNLENNFKNWLFMSDHHRKKKATKISLLGYARYSGAIGVPKPRMGQEKNWVIRSYMVYGSVQPPAL